MSVFKWLIAGLIGASIGGAAWVAIGYFANFEVGWIAWGIGLLAGIGVRVAADDNQEGAAPGVAAVAAAAGVIALAKYLVISLQINAAFAEVNAQEPMTDAAMEQTILVSMADEVVAEYEQQGKPVTWAPGMSVELAQQQADYPPEIWGAARERWDALPLEERQELIGTTRARQQEFMQVFQASMKDEVFKQSFGPWDLLWFGLAAFTAFRVGSGAQHEG